MVVRYSRAELQGIVAARHGQHEGQGDHAWLDFRIRITPELLESLLGGTWETPDGRRARLDHVYVTDDGYAEPFLVWSP